MEYWWKDTNRGKHKYWNCPSVTGLESNPKLRRERPVLAAIRAGISNLGTNIIVRDTSLRRPNLIHREHLECFREGKSGRVVKLANRLNCVGFSPVILTCWKDCLSMENKILIWSRCWLIRSSLIIFTGVKSLYTHKHTHLPNTWSQLDTSLLRWYRPDYCGRLLDSFFIKA